LGFEAVADGGVRRIPSSIFEVAEGQSATVAVEAAPVEAALSAPVEYKAPRIAPRGRILQRRILEEREEETDALAAKLRRHFRGIRNRVDGILGRYMERQTGEAKAFPFDVEDMLPPLETGNLSDILRAAQAKASKRTFQTISSVGVAGELDWSEKLPVIQRILNTAPARAQMIHRTTSKAIGTGVKIALERGYSIEQLARGVPDDNFPGLRSILTETDNRARLIARTETMRTQNQSSIGYYQTQGMMYVQADDVDGDADDTYVDPGDPFGRTCAERHGQIYQLADAHNIDDHPNGTLNWMPMPRGYQPDEAALDVPTMPDAPVDRADPFSPDFQADAWNPEVKLGPGVNPNLSGEAVANIRYTAVNMKGDLGAYLAKLYAKTPKSAPTILRRKSRLFNLHDPRTGKPMKAGGFYSPAKDTIRVSDTSIEYAMSHEIGHQLMTPKHMVAMVGKDKANKFWNECQKAFAAAQKRHTEPYTFERQGRTFKNPGIRGTVTDYGMGNIDEYVAEGFKWAMQSPSKFKGVDDDLLRIMRKYLVKDKPASIQQIRAGS